MEDINIEVPLSNKEVLKVLSAKKDSNNNEKYIKILEYLNDTFMDDKYNFELLRQLKSEESIEANLSTLCMLSNTNKTSLVNKNDLDKINNYLKKHKV